MDDEDIVELKLRSGQSSESKNAAERIQRRTLVLAMRERLWIDAAMLTKQARALRRATMLGSARSLLFDVLAVYRLALIILNAVHVFF